MRKGLYMKKTLVVLFFALFSAGIFADTQNVAPEFGGKTGCFILYNFTENKSVVEYNPQQCAQRIPADSTFKIPLSLMAFDQHLITQQTIFKWDGIDRGLPQWNQDQTPHTWLKNSAVWVSQQLTPQLGLDKIKNYLQKFSYGNQDFSGDPGQSNGLTHAWLESSLKISPDEQLIFLKKLVANQLPVSTAAMMNTKTNMYLETSPNDWKIYGKTGSGFKDDIQHGWFEGFIQKAGQTYIFVADFSAQQNNVPSAGGPEAKDIVKSILTKMGF